MLQYIYNTLAMMCLDKTFSHGIILTNTTIHLIINVMLDFWLVCKRKKKIITTLIYMYINMYKG